MKSRDPITNEELVRTLIDGGNSLELSDRHLSDAHLDMLLARPELARIVALDLSKNDLTDAAIEHLAGCQTLANLESLDLWWNDLTTISVRHLVSSVYLPRLRSLVLGHNALGDEGVTALAQSDLLARIEVLNLGFCEATAHGRDVLLRSPQVSRIRALRIRGWPFDPPAVHLLASSTAWVALEEIDFSDNDLGPKAIGDDELELLIRAVATLPRLRRVVYIPPRIWGAGLDVVKWREKLDVLIPVP